MFFKMLGIILSILACVSIYLTHPNQILRRTRLPKIFAYAGSIGLGIALIMLLLSTQKLVAIFIWLAAITLVWSFIPFLNLLKRSNAQ